MAVKSNDKMVAGRIKRYADARKTVGKIQDHLKSGGVVQVVTYTKATQYSAKHAGMFKATPTGATVQHGKGSVCIDGAHIRYGRYVKNS